MNLIQQDTTEHVDKHLKFYSIANN